MKQCSKTISNDKLLLANDFYKNLNEILYEYKFDVLFINNHSTNEKYYFDIAIKDIKKDEIENQLFLIENYISGHSLEELRTLQNLDLNTIIHYALELCTILSGLHNMNPPIVHRDIKPSNIIITEDGTPYILDWSHAAQGSATADAVRTYLLFLFSGDTEGAKYYMDSFCERTNTDKHYAQKWIPLVAVAQSVKVKEEEKEFLLDCVYNVKYE